MQAIRNIGLSLLLVFEFERDTAIGFYLRHIVPQRQTNTELSYDIVQLMLIYKPMIDRVINHLAKTTPKAKRTAIATAALCEAVQSYDPNFGDLSEYLEDYLRKSLITENRQYVAAYRELRIDAPFRASGDNGFSLLDILTDQHSGDIPQTGAKIMAERFRATLSSQECHLIHLMHEELKLPQIALEVQLTQDEIMELGR